MLRKFKINIDLQNINIENGNLQHLISIFSFIVFRQLIISNALKDVFQSAHYTLLSRIWLPI
jgi:hypothetical protein